MPGIYSVGQINLYIKRMFTEDFVLKNLSVKGEISNCKYHSSGHIYFSLKDSSGVISCVMFSGNRSGLSFRMEEGQTVVVSGSVNVYERDGKYQVYAREIHLDGDGVLYQKFEELKKQLEEMGMFSSEYKKEIPAYATKVGIVTASTGAALQDIINVAKRRNPYVELILAPTQVQGEGAAKSIVSSLKKLDILNLDVIILGRGGGSIEDLWAFNEEITARGIFECHTPVISAVGHETDTTISDFVSDLRAPTPSAAAEIAVFDFDAFDRKLSDIELTFEKLLHLQLERKKGQLENLQTKLKYLSPWNQIQQKRQQIEDAELKIKNRMNNLLKEKRYLLSLYAERLNGLSPLNRLGNGYAYVTNEKSMPIYGIDNLSEEDILNIRFKNGIVESKIIRIQTGG